jgi:hypothetical protein
MLLPWVTSESVVGLGLGQASELRVAVVGLGDIGEDSGVGVVADGASRGGSAYIVLGGLKMEVQIGPSFVGDGLLALFESSCSENNYVTDPDGLGVGWSVGTGVVDAVVDLFPQYFEGNREPPLSCHGLVASVEVCGFDLPMHGVEVIDELEAGGVWKGGMLVSSQALVRSTFPLLRPACGEQCVQ